MSYELRARSLRFSLFAFRFWLFAFFLYECVWRSERTPLPPYMGSNRIMGLRGISCQSLERNGLRGKVLILLDLIPI